MTNFQISKLCLILALGASEAFCQTAVAGEAAEGTADLVASADEVIELSAKRECRVQFQEMKQTLAQERIAVIYGRANKDKIKTSIALLLKLEELKASPAMHYEKLVQKVKKVVGYNVDAYLGYSVEIPSPTTFSLGDVCPNHPKTQNMAAKINRVMKLNHRVTKRTAILRHALKALLKYYGVNSGSNPSVQQLGTLSKEIIVQEAKKAAQ